MEDYHYKHKDFVMTPTEHEFFNKLREIVGDEYYIFPQIHLGTIIRPSVKWTYKWKLWRLAFFYSDKYSVDYLICDTQEIKPLLVIELDDKSHMRENRRRRDKFVEKALSEAKLPMARFKVDDISNYDKVERNIFSHI